ncbi:MAG: pilus assembly protein CpaD [Sphingomonadales bacterium]|nr:pilus assembly protein CpaD [Sphingomonadales bacterium]
MARNPSLAALVAIGAALSLAGAADARPPRHGPERGLDSLNQPVVVRTDYVLDLAGSDGGLSPAERARLDHWFQSLALGYGDHIFVDEGQGYGSGRRDVARTAAEYGILLSEGAPITEGSVPPGGVRVVVSRSTASVPNCPNWSARRGPSSISSNYGCALNSNFAAMIADPNDLVLGQSGSVTGDANTSSKAIRVYRQTAPTGTKGLSDVSTRGN